MSLNQVIRTVDAELAAGTIRERASTGGFAPGSRRPMVDRMKAGATKSGVGFDEYLSQLKIGRAWCGHHRRFESVKDFNNEKRRWIGLANICRAAKRAARKRVAS